MYVYMKYSWVVFFIFCWNCKEKKWHILVQLAKPLHYRSHKLASNVNAKLYRKLAQLVLKYFPVFASKSASVILFTILYFYALQPRWLAIWSGVSGKIIRLKRKYYKKFGKNLTIRQFSSLKYSHRTSWIISVLYVHKTKSQRITEYKTFGAKFR